MLAASTRSSVGVDAEVFLIDIDLLVFIRLQKDSNSDGRSVDSTLRFSLRNALYAVRTTLILQ